MDIQKERRACLLNLTLQQKELREEKELLDKISDNLDALPDQKIGLDSAGKMLTATQKRFRKMKKPDLERHKLAAQLVKIISDKEFSYAVVSEERTNLTKIAESIAISDKQIMFFTGEDSPIGEALELKKLEQFDGTVKQFRERMLKPLKNRFVIYEQELQKAHGFFERNPFIKTCTIKAHRFGPLINPLAARPETIIDTSFALDAARFAMTEKVGRFNLEFDGDIILMPQVKDELDNRLNKDNLPRAIFTALVKFSEQPDHDAPTDQEVQELTAIWKKERVEKDLGEFQDKRRADIHILTRTLRRAKRGRKTLILSDDKDITKVAKALEKRWRKVAAVRFDEAIKNVA